ncbi:unnamed protein product [Oppiella nova]|uniref:Cation-transporting P-type ATPase N-terminal domain-containing protein n=1 Tax=Oppiella nova TaxID=334625 RepID=A0A7R9LVG2_9ACAR|nr:unnamed protein product [Oppiella nova]CAG2167384.1 unnamed protein product [Oppiella nova]
MTRKLSFDLIRKNTKTPHDMEGNVGDQGIKNNKFQLKWPKWLRKDTDKTTNKEDIDLAKEVTIEEHLYTLNKLCQTLGTSCESGISDSEADVRLKRDGPNAFTPPKQTAWYILLGRQMTTAFAIILWIASIISFACYAIDTNIEYIIVGVALALVVIITGTYSYSQEASSSKIFKSFKNMIPQPGYGLHFCSRLDRRPLIGWPELPFAAHP